MSERTDKLRTKLMPGDKNVIASPLVLIDKIIFSPLYIKPRITKQLAKVSDKKDKCFEYQCNTFPGISIEKNKIEIFDCPDIRKLAKDPHFIESVNAVASRAWTFSKSVIQNLLYFRREKEAMLDSQMVSSENTTGILVAK